MLNINIPKDIQDKILKDKGVHEEKVYGYRICKSGKIEISTFDSTYEEILNNVIPDNKDRTDISTYSTSLFSNIKKIKKFLKLQKKHNPPSIIIGGYTKYGLIRKNDKCHVDWWIYNNYKEKLVNEHIFKEYID